MTLLFGLWNTPAATDTINLLEDGRLNHWYTWIKERGRDTDPKGVFTLQNGILHISGEEWGCVTSKEEYENYHAVLEFKWGERTHAPRVGNARDSGFLVHSLGEDGGYSGTWMHCLEVQMIEGGTGDLLVVGDASPAYEMTVTATSKRQDGCPVFTPDGEPVTMNSGRFNWWGRDPSWADVKGFRGGRDVEKPVGEWNRLEVIADGDNLTLLLNGIVVNRASGCKPHKGRLQIQSESAELFVRRVELTPLVQDVAAVFGPRRSGPMLLVANKHSDTLSYVRYETLQVEQTITVGHNPHELVITPDRRTMYLSNYEAPGNTVSVVDLVARKHIKQIPTGEYTRIHGAAMAPDGKNAYFTAGQTGYVVEVDTATNQVTRGLPTHGKISHMILVSNDNQRLYTANIETENISVIDRKSGELITQIQCERGAEGMAFTPDGKQLWVANQSGGSMTIIDLATHTVVERFELPGMPIRIKFTKDGKRAYIPSWTPKGELIVLDVPSRQEIKRVKVGGLAIGIELSPDEKRAFVGCENRDGLHVVNTDTLEVEAVIDTGDGPDPISMWYPPR
jgi:YVTN family beta-propeller protein